MALNVTTAVIGSGCQRAVASPSLAQWDRGQILKITGIELPQVYNVEFCCQGDLTTTTMLGGADGVEIPNLLLQRGLPIIAYLVLHEGQDDRETEYWITIYVKQRAMPPSVTPDPEQADIIDQLVAALDEGVTAAENAAAQAEAQVAYYPTVIDGTWHVWNALTESWVDTEVPATGPAGRGITGVTQNEDYTLTLTFTDGTDWTTPTPVRGATGATPNLTIGSVTTGGAGSSAAASITGTKENPVLSLTIPQGLKGDPGNGDAIAPTFSASTAYPAGAYVIYSGNLYRFTTAHAAGAWTGADAVAAVLGNDVSELKGEISDFTTEVEVKTETQPTTSAGLYINNTAFGTAADTVFFLHYIAVEAGKKYLITADRIRTMYAQVGIVAFSPNEPANGGSCVTLVPGTETEMSLNYYYTPQASGYLSVATYTSIPTVLHFYSISYVTRIDTDSSLTIANFPADAKATGDRFGLLGYGEVEKADVIPAKYTVDDRYIGSTGKINSAGSNAYKVSWYPILAGKSYNISGKGAVGGAGQTLVGFDNEYDSSTGHIIKTVIQTATTTLTEYDIDYTPTEDGYIVMPTVTQNQLVVRLVEEIDYQRIYDIEQEIKEIDAEIGRTKIPIKIQLFGDSITDNQWGDTKTWANYIQENLYDYDVTVVNDAVGGSGIGHGKSSGTTPSHQTDEYNHVYDLVTDGVTLQTDADYVVILAGTNNWASGTDLGDMSSTGYSTIYGALKGILEYISQHSAATVFVCTIPQRYNTTDQGRTTNTYGEPLNADNVSLADFCEPYRKVSAFYGMPCVHLNEALGWNRINILDFCDDGLHPNTKGDKMLSAFICSEIHKHIGRVAYS